MIKIKKNQRTINIHYQEDVDIHTKFLIWQLSSRLTAIIFP